MTQWLGGRERVDQKELASALNAAFTESMFMVSTMVSIGQ
jgi:hypothetical protein